MNSDITLDTVSRQIKELREIEEILEFVEWEQDRLIEVWGEKKFETISDILREEYRGRQSAMVNNLGKLYKGE